MADAVTTQTLFDTPYRTKVHWTNVSDGTGESAVKKLDITSLKASDNAQPSSLDIESVRWAVQGFTFVKVLWNHNTADTALVVAGTGYDDFRNDDVHDGRLDFSSLKDPRSAGGDGSILLTTNGAANNCSYDITVTFKKKPD